MTTSWIDHWSESPAHIIDQSFDFCLWNIVPFLNERLTNFVDEGRKEMFYLTTHSTHYLGLYGVTHVVKYHSDWEKGNPLPAHRLLFPISNKGSFMCIIPPQDNTYHGLCCTSRGAQWVRRHEGSIRRPIAPRANALTTELISLRVGTTPQSSVQTIPDMLDGVEIRTISGPVINEINVICSIYSVSMWGGIIMLTEYYRGHVEPGMHVQISCCRQLTMPNWILIIQTKVNTTYII